MNVMIQEIVEKIAGPLSMWQKATLAKGPCVLYHMMAMRPQLEGLWQIANLEGNVQLAELAKEELDRVAHNYGFGRWERDSVMPNAYIVSKGVIVRY